MTEAPELPALLEEISTVVGRAAALAIAAARGGRRVYVPASLPARHWLIDAVGVDAAQRLARHFAHDGRGAYLDIPFGSAGSYAQQRAERARALRAAVAGGISVDQAAARAGITRRSVQRFKAKADRRDPRQRDLFPND